MLVSKNRTECLDAANSLGRGLRVVKFGGAELVELPTAAAGEDRRQCYSVVRSSARSVGTGPLPQKRLARKYHPERLVAIEGFLILLFSTRVATVSSKVQIGALAGPRKR
jgi:hypothetical protein